MQQSKFKIGDYVKIRESCYVSDKSLKKFFLKGGKIENISYPSGIFIRVDFGVISGIKRRFTFYKFDLVKILLKNQQLLFDFWYENDR